MSALSNQIELFLKELMAQSKELVFQRNELAQHFQCAPSQINYVLSTRFTLDQGYIVVSQRGGGGHIRLIRVDMDRNELLYELSTQQIENELTLHQALGMITRLYANHIISEREAHMMQAIVQNTGLPTKKLQDIARASAMRAMLLALLQEDLS